MPENNEMPWLIFEIQKTFYALNCANIQAIIPMPRNTDQTSLPDAPHYIRGLTKVRESVIPILGLRELYDMPSVAEEYESFKQQIDQRKSEHVHWVDELKRSVDEGTEFTLATDPRQCAFGKWYYNHDSLNSSVNFVLSKIEEPHRKFHEAGLEVLQCAQNHDQCLRDTCLKAAFQAAKEDLMPKVLTLLDEVKEIFTHSYQEKLIILKDGQKSIGVVVDDVKAIDELQLAEGQEEFIEAMKNQHIFAVGRGKKRDDLILLVHTEELLNLVQDGRSNLLQ